MPSPDRYEIKEKKSTTGGNIGYRVKTELGEK